MEPHRRRPYNERLPWFFRCPVDRLTARQLFDLTAEHLDLRWVGGLRGEGRTMEAVPVQGRRTSWVGYLNIIYPNRVQIVGGEELSWLDGLESRQRWKTIQKILAQEPTALLVSKNQTVPGDLLEAAEEAGTPLWVSARSGHEILTWLRYLLARRLAPQATLHGVFMEVYSIGVLITGDAGTGKSELALELITRGHRLVADDAPEFTRISPDLIDGSCPEILQDLLEVRGLGVLDVRQMFGHTAVKLSKYLRLILHLTTPTSDSAADAMTRLTGDVGYREVLEMQVPMLTIPVAPGRNLAVLAEAAVRSHLLRSKGIDPAQSFIDRQAHQMRQLPPW